MRTTLLASSLALAFLAACGGGGGGGGVRQPVPSFTSFDSIEPNQTVVLNGKAVTAHATDDAITSVSEHSDGSATLSYDGDRLLKTLSVSTPQSSVTFDASNGVCEGAVCAATNANETAVAGYIDPGIAGWNYQSFGVWIEQVSTNTFVGGAISVGAPTAAVPLSGEAIFTGLAGGLYSDASGPASITATAATMRANVNFGSRDIGFTTGGTTLISPSGSTTDRADLNLSGALSYAPGVNAFTGPVVTTNTELTGTGSGQFYGPTAQEIGGVYSLQGSGQTMIGGFGGTR